MVNRFKEFSRSMRESSKKFQISKNFKWFRNVEHIKIYIHITQKLKKPQKKTKYTTVHNKQIRTKNNNENNLMLLSYKMKEDDMDFFDAFFKERFRSSM